MTVIILAGLAQSLFATEPLFQAKDEKLEEIVIHNFYSGIISKIYSNNMNQDQLLEQLSQAGSALKEYAAFLEQTGKDDGRRRNIEVARALQKYLTQTKATLLQQGYTEALEEIEKLYDYVNYLLNSVEIEVVVEVKRFSTKFVAQHSGNSLGKKAIVGITGQVRHENIEFCLPEPERFREFLKKNSSEMVLTIGVPADDSRLEELEKLPDVYGYPKRAVKIIGKVRLFHIVTRDINVIVPELMQIKKIIY